MMRTTLLWATLFAVALHVETACARTIYVNNVAGADRNDGSSPQAIGLSGPVRTINRALELAQRADRIVIANTDEPYRESIALAGERHSGLLESPFIVEGNGAVLDGTTPVLPTAWEHYRGDTFRFRPRRMSHQLLYEAGEPLPQRPADKTALTPPALEPREWCLHGGYLYFRVEAGKLPADYDLWHCDGQTGLTLYGVSNVIVADLIVQGFWLDGVSAPGLVRQAHLSGVVARGNGRSGVAVAGSSKVRFARGIIGDNGASQVRVSGYATLDLIETELLDHTAPAWALEGGTLLIDGKPSAVEP